jgi:hypothetical protein
LNQFVLSCDNALEAVPHVSQNGETDHGIPVTDGQLTQLNEKISIALKKLNTDMNTDPSWKPVSFDELAPSLYGSIRFQVIQLECRVYASGLNR